MSSTRAVFRNVATVIMVASIGLFVIRIFGIATGLGSFILLLAMGGVILASFLTAMTARSREQRRYPIGGLIALLLAPMLFWIMSSRVQPGCAGFMDALLTMFFCFALACIGTGCSLVSLLLRPRVGEPGGTGSCIRCGYNLYGLTESRCPECGTVFDPEAAHASVTANWRRKDVFGRMLARWLGTASIVASFLLSVFVMSAPEYRVWLIGVGFGCMVGGTLILGGLRHARQGRYAISGLTLLLAPFLLVHSTFAPGGVPRFLGAGDILGLSIGVVCLVLMLLGGVYVTIAVLVPMRSAQARRTGCCARCGYFLEGLVGSACPECGMRSDSPKQVGSGQHTA